MPVIKVPGSERTYRIVLEDISGGLATYSFPHLIKDNELAVADNVAYSLDGLVEKRPGNINYGGGSGATGSGLRALAMTRFYFGAPPSGKLLVHSGTNLYQGTDNTGAFTAVNGANALATNGAAGGAMFQPMYDPDMSSGAAEALFICDGVHTPFVYDGTHYVSVSVAAGFLPGTGVSGSGAGNITPAYVCKWGPYLVYAGEPTNPTGIYISDALRPERFSGYSLIDSAGTTYTPYFPDGANTDLGVITGIIPINGILLIFFTAGVVAAYNSGTYGAFEFQFQALSGGVGCPSPRSIVAFETFVIFFGGDRFYACDGYNVVPLPNMIPSVYGATQTSAFPPEMKTKNTVVSVRRSNQYWASYDVTGNGIPSRVVMFDTHAGGGWYFGQPSGGRWARWPSGMPVGTAIECRGPGDNFQMFWGSSAGDLVAQHDTGLYSDFGNPISVEIRGKSFFLDKPTWPKTVQGLNVLLLYQQSGAGYTDTITPYVLADQTVQNAPSLVVTVPKSGTLYGTSDYGTFLYQSSQGVAPELPKGYPAQPAIGYSIAPGILESTTNPFACIGFVLELTIDEPAP